MAYDEKLRCQTLLAEADNSGDQYKFVTNGTTGRGFALCGAGEQAIGVLQNNPTNDGTGEPAGTVAILDAGGVSKVLAGAAITAGASVASDAAGKAVTAVATDVILGTAETAASGDGAIVSVRLEAAGRVQA